MTGDRFKPQSEGCLISLTFDDWTFPLLSLDESTFNLTGSWIYFRFTFLIKFFEANRKTSDETPPNRQI